MAMIEPDAIIAAKARRPASALMRDCANAGTGDAVSVGAMMAVFGERGFALLLILFSLPNLVPTPGLGEIFGIPLFLLGLQMARGRPTPWLPLIIANKTMRRTTLTRIVDLIEPKMRKIEASLKPRWYLMSTARLERAIGVFTMFCAVPVLIPFPGTNLPMAVALLLVSLGFMEEDGAVLMVGVGIGSACLLYTSAVLVGLIWLGPMAFSRMLTG